MTSIDRLNLFITDIQEAQKVDRESAMIELITTRLDKCLNTYIVTLNKDIHYLKERNQLKLIRNLTK